MTFSPAFKISSRKDGRLTSNQYVRPYWFVNRRFLTEEHKQTSARLSAITPSLPFITFCKKLCLRDLCALLLNFCHSPRGRLRSAVASLSRTYSFNQVSAARSIPSPL